MSNRVIEAILRITGKANTNQMARQVGRDLDSINKRAAAFNRQNTLIARGSRAAFATVTRYAAPAALAYAAKGALVDFAAVERQMTRIGITAGASASETNAAFAQLQNMAKQIALPVDQAITALDTLTSSGMSLKEAMDFLPSILATAQASGSATEDIANTAIKASSALQIEADKLQRAFDIMVVGGKAGQFELKDMAAYIPELANSFASLGYKGEDGLKELIALLQTLREDTGTAEAAATQAQNIFGKMYSSDTASKFKQFGIDLRSEMEAAKKNGEDAVSAFVRLSKEAVKGNLSKLPLLFTDQEFRLGMQSLMTSADSYKKFIDAVNSNKVDGTVLKDLNTILGDTQSSIDRMSESWGKLTNSFGKAVARPAVPVMNAVSNDLDFGEAVRSSLEKQGKSYWERESWMAMNLPFGSLSKSRDAEKLALEGGYRDPAFIKRMTQGPNRPVFFGPELPEFPGGDRKLDAKHLPETGVPTPSSRTVTTPVAPNIADIYGQYASSRRDGERQAHAAAVQAGMPAPLFSIPQGVKDFFRMPSKEELKDALKIDATGLKQSGDEAGQSVADGGKEAGDSMKRSILDAGTQVAAQISAAIAQTMKQSQSFNRGMAGPSARPPVNADLGRSMAPAAPGSTAGGGGGGGF